MFSRRGAFSREDLFTFVSLLENIERAICNICVELREASSATEAARKSLTESKQYLAKARGAENARNDEEECGPFVNTGSR